MKYKVVEAVNYGKSSNRLEANEPSEQETELILQGIEQTQEAQFVSAVVKLVKVPENKTEEEEING